MFHLALMWTLKRTSLLLALGAVLSPSALAKSASAEFVLDGRPFKLIEVAAFLVRQPSNQRNFVTYVVLTAKPVDEEKIKSSADPLMSLDQDPAVHGNYIGVWILADGTIEVAAHVDGDAYTGEAYPAGSPGVPGELVGMCKVNTTTHVACKAKTKKPAKTRDGRTCTLDVTFDAEVLAHPRDKPAIKDTSEAGAPPKA